jgi:hypothetical protein
MNVLRACVGFSLVVVVAIGCGGSNNSFVVSNDGGSGDTSVAAAGTETGACYPNGTCNTGLVCLSNVCVKPGDAGAVGDTSSDSLAVDDAAAPDQASSDTGPIDASTADAGPIDAALNDTGAGEANASDTGASDARDDAGMLCPGADILHPGPQTRMAGTSVPFVGRARDASCTPITGMNLVWTDSREGAIGTGETFSHTFIVMGTHTVTLRATDGQGRVYTATVTFIIV